MKRSPLKRRTPLRTKRAIGRNIPGDGEAKSSAPPRRKALISRNRAQNIPRNIPARKPLKRKPPRRLKRPGTDPVYLALVRLLGCCAPLSPPTKCFGAMQAHHPRHLAGGKGLKAPDDTAIPLCLGHHGSLHAKAAPFRQFSRAELIEWQNLRVDETRRRLGRAA